MFKRMDVSDIELSAETLEEITKDDETNDDLHDEDIHHQIGNVFIEEEKGKDNNDDNDDIVYDEKGFDPDGFNKEGFNDKGFNKDGFDKDDKDVDGKEREIVYDDKGFDDKGFDKDGFDKDGLNDKGLNKDGFNKDDKTVDGRKKEDFTDGFDEKGFDPHGYDKDGKDVDGKEKIDPNEESPNTEQSSNEDEPLDLKAIIDGEKEVKVKTEDGKEVDLKDILKDYTNDKKWQKTNTEKDQAVAKERKALETDKKTHDETIVAFDDIVKKLNDKEFLEGAEEFYGDEKNPVTELLKAVKDGKSSLANSIKQAEKDEKELIDKEDADIKDQVDAIRKDDPAYNDMDKMQELFDTATELKVSLPVAYDLNKVPLLQEKLKTQETESKKTIDELTKSKADIEKELKERNEEVAELKKNPKPIEPKKDKLSKGASADDEVDNSPVDGFDEAEKRIRKKLGLDD